MEYFVRVVMDKVEGASKLDESIFPSQEIYETAQDCTVFQFELPRELTESEADEYANRLANVMFENGYEDFDIEMGSEGSYVDEETYDDDDEFFEAYGMLHYNLDDDPMDEAEYQGRKVKLGKPMQGDVKKFKVYVRDPSTKKIKVVRFGDPNMEIKRDDPARRKSFRARHNCENPGPKTKARYWSCYQWRSGAKVDN